MNYDDCITVLSKERIAPYLKKTGNNFAEALHLYEQELLLCSAMHIPLHILEVTLRNAFERIFIASFGQEWYHNQYLLTQPKQQQRIEKAFEDIISEKKQITSANVIAKLNLGFWAGMFGTDYENHWQQYFYRIAKDERGKHLTRKDFSKKLEKIRVLRNRIAHHESVLSWDIKQNYQNILQMLAWLHLPASLWCNKISRISYVTAIAVE